MTCIAGNVTKTEISIGGDYLCTSMDDGSRYEGAEKVVRTTNWAIGMAGSSRVERYIHLFKEQHPTYKFKTTRDVYILTDWLQETLDGVLAVAEDSTDFLSYPFELMVASKNGLWVIETDLSVYQITDYAVIGSGSQCGLGAMSAGISQYPPEELYPALMKVVSKHNTTVGKDAWFYTFPL